MNTTDFEKEATQFEENVSNEQSKVNSSNNKGSKGRSSKESIKAAAIGAGTGLFIGGLSTFFMGMKAESDDNVQDGTESNNDEHAQTAWADDQVHIATSVNDDMSFSEAFAAARSEVGPGGAFEWHGKIYGTYYADEWNNMTAEERAEYGSHFNWNNIDHSTSDVAQSEEAHHSDTAQTTAGTDDVEIVSVNHVDDLHADATDGDAHAELATSETPIAEDSMNVEVLGVVHDSDSGANIGAMTVDGHDMMVVDVDGDMQFDYAAMDCNGNGVIDSDEIVDIQGQNLTVNDMGGFSDPMAYAQASNDNVDYTVDPSADSVL